MRVKLQCKGPQDTDWCTLQTFMYPSGLVDSTEKDQRKTDLRIDSAMGGWSRYFGYDHAFRVVKA